MSDPIRCSQCGATLSGPDEPCCRCLLAVSLETGEGSVGTGLSSDPAAECEGRVLGGRYRILDVLGRGSFGVVYRAVQVNLDREVAVKMLREGAFSNEAERALFLREAKAIAQLNHPNIVGIHDWGEEDGQPFFSMELVVGSSLAECIREQPLPPEEAARLMERVARAIHVVHQHGLLHRDLKPANILLSNDGVPKITDFGLAKPARGDIALTMPGHALGSPGFMAPEQAAGNGASIGPSSDIYGLGATLYCLLTARAPFVSDSLLTMLRQVAEARPLPPRQLNPAIPREIEAVCMKCLEKIPGRRYANALELAEELAAFNAGARKQEERRALRGRAQRRLGVALAGVALTAALGGGTWAVIRVLRPAPLAAHSPGLSSAPTNPDRVQSPGDPEAPASAGVSDERERLRAGQQGGLSVADGGGNGPTEASTAVRKDELRPGVEAPASGFQSVIPSPSVGGSMAVAEPAGTTGVAVSGSFLQPARNEQATEVAAGESALPKVVPAVQPALALAGRDRLSGGAKPTEPATSVTALATEAALQEATEPAKVASPPAEVPARNPEPTPPKAGKVAVVAAQRQTTTAVQPVLADLAPRPEVDPPRNEVAAPVAYVPYQRPVPAKLPPKRRAQPVLPETSARSRVLAAGEEEFQADEALRSEARTLSTTLAAPSDLIQMMRSLVRRNEQGIKPADAAAVDRCDAIDKKLGVFFQAYACKAAVWEYRPEIRAEINALMVEREVAIKLIRERAAKAKFTPRRKIYLFEKKPLPTPIELANELAYLPAASRGR